MSVTLCPPVTITCEFSPVLHITRCHRYPLELKVNSMTFHNTMVVVLYCRVKIFPHHINNFLSVRASLHLVEQLVNCCLFIVNILNIYTGTTGNTFRSFGTSVKLTSVVSGYIVILCIM